MLRKGLFPNCPVLLHEYLGPITKKQWLYTHTQPHLIVIYFRLCTTSWSFLWYSHCQRTFKISGKRLFKSYIYYRKRICVYARKVVIYEDKKSRKNWHLPTYCSNPLLIGSIHIFILCYSSYTNEGMTTSSLM